MSFKTIAGITSVLCITMLSGCNDNLKPSVDPEITRIDCYAGGNSPRGMRGECKARIGVGITFRGVSAPPGTVDDYLSLMQGRYDLSRSNVQITSTGTSIILTANTIYGPTQHVFAITQQGNGARLAAPVDAASWLASVDASARITSVQATVQAIQYVKQEGINAVNVDVIADGSNITLATTGYSAYIQPGTITPEPGPR